MSGEKRIRVLYVVSGVSHEGIGSYLLNVVKNIDKDKFEISFALATDYKQAHEDKLLELDCNIYRTAEIGNGVKGKILHFVNLIRLIKKDEPFDILHTHMDFFNGINLLAAYIGKVPVRISHGHLDLGNQNINMIKKLYNYLMKVIIKICCNYKLGCSLEANKYINGVKENDIKSSVVNNGINFERFNNKHKRKYIQSSKVKFITIGRIEEPKNPIFIVEIMNELCMLRNEVELIWIGVGSLEDDVKKRIENYNLSANIKMLGRRDDVDLILQESDFMLFPSKYEGLGIALIEAQLAGVPAFISNTIPKEANLGLCTILNLEDSAKEWARKIDLYINQKNYSNSFDKNKANKFDIRETTKELENIYIKLVNV